MEEESIKRFQDILIRHRNPDNAGPMQKYMKNHFSFIGLKSQERRNLTYPFLREHEWHRPPLKKELLRKVWGLKEREYQYAVVDALDLYQKHLQEEDIDFLIYCITEKPWWDTVDPLAAKICGSYFQAYPERIPEYTETWVTHENKWLRRTAILFQLKYKESTDEDRLFDYIRSNADHNDFFIQKAIGWALREYSKTAPESVADFIEKEKLAPLSRREGMKHIQRVSRR
ncbi:DNA alkylation repair protein [Alteribacillus sp. HJP-4]|uniref:DNA alkylation repair protein n=1 Tax=Alteribacillus sp. HJP-4 TaxID=2775394 RepID=UPI0035CCFA88